MAGLERFAFHIVERPKVEVEGVSAVRGMRAASVERTDPGFASFEGIDTGFGSDEAAARHYLSRILTGDERPAMRAIAAPEEPEVVPDLHFAAVQELPGTETRLVRFEQTKEGIPVFGGHAVCELTFDRDLISASGAIARVTEISTIATLSQSDALELLAEHLDVDVASIEGAASPELQLFVDGPGTWHLVWLFRNIPVAPRDLAIERHGHGLGRSPRDLEPRLDYLVDAHDGTLVYYYSAAPTVMTPTYGSGIDENDESIQFLGQMVGTTFKLHDPLRNVVTYDHQFLDIRTPALGSPVQGSNGNFGNTMKAVVSAHANASIVDDFYRGVLQRDGVDDKGMELVNVVNCTYAKDEPPPDWRNAVWWDNRMWYGQVRDGTGLTRSFSRFLDIIAHELTHGVTSFTSGLVYRDQPGALSESYSDILGIIIKNWDRSDPVNGGDVSGWSWHLGVGLGENGGPMRDMSDPSVTGDPAHMNDYLTTVEDFGGVHTNSNIHNKAAYNVLTSTEADGSRTFTPRDCAYLFYIGLSRLGRLSNFSDSLAAVAAVAETLWEGKPQRVQKVAAIRLAYQQVGIT